MALKLEDVESNNILQIGYEQSTRKLGVVFKHDPATVYVYATVPKNVWDSFYRASSKGVFHAQHIKNKYSFTKQHVSHG